MFEEDYIAAATVVMSDNRMLPVHIRVQQAWIIISGLQLATRHPDISPMLREDMERIARQFQHAIVELHPSAAKLLELGWHPEHDLPPH